MVEVYYYVPADKLADIAECGLKLSEWYSRELHIGGELKKCMTALLNPRDNIAAYKSRDLKCVRLEVNPKYCFIADGFLYRMSAPSGEIKRPEIFKLYEQSVIPAEEYKFGKYRMPECLVSCTVIGEAVKALDGKFESFLLFDNSEELYFNNMLECMKEEHDDFNDAILYCLLDAAAKTGKIDKIEDGEGNMALFKETSGGKYYTIKIPDISKYAGGFQDAQG